MDVELKEVVPDSIRRSYVLKFGIALLVLGASVGALGSVGTLAITDEVRADANDARANIALQEAVSIRDWNQEHVSYVETISRTEAVQSGSPDRISRYFQRERQRQTQGGPHLYYVDVGTGTILASTKSGRKGEPVSVLNETLQSHLEMGAGTVVTDDVYLASSEFGSGTPRVAYVTGVPDQSDRKVVYTVPVRDFSESLEGNAEQGVALVVDASTGRIAFHERGEQLLQKYAEPSTPVQRGADLDVGESLAVVAGPPEGSLTRGNYGLEGKRYVVGMARVENTDWVVLAHVSTQEAYGSVQAARTSGLLATGLGVLLIGFVGAILGWNTSRAIDRLTVKTRRMEQGDLTVELETDRIDNIGQLYDGFAAMRDALREQIQEAQSAREEAEDARERAEAMTGHLESKADEYSRVMEEVADGDLTRRMEPDERNEQMREIAQAFNGMVAELEQTVDRVKDFATEVATSSEEVTASSEEVKSASEQVTESIQEIADGADRQNDQLRSVTEEMDGLSTTIEEIAASANEVAELSEQTAETGADARESAELAISEMMAVEAEAEATVDAMESLEEQMQEIEEITEFITEVAEQTNILALNANIEAARAGEAGSGFAVVADEVKDLAEDTREAAADIEGLVERVQEQTQATAGEVEDTSAEVTRSMEIVEETVEALDEIAGYAQETNTGVQEISDATTEQASSTNQVVGMVDDAASISEQTSRESENVAAAAEEQTTALTEVTNSASGLAEQASRLSSALERFETIEVAGELEGDVDEPAEADDGGPAALPEGVANIETDVDEPTGELPGPPDEGAEPPASDAGDEGAGDAVEGAADPVVEATDLVETVVEGETSEPGDVEGETGEPDDGEEDDATGEDAEAEEGVSVEEDARAEAGVEQSPEDDMEPADEAAEAATGPETIPDSAVEEWVAAKDAVDESPEAGDD
jgi:methyl-accepting chemotaxis protein